jgi:choline monooxygenase
MASVPSTTESSSQLASEFNVDLETRLNQPTEQGSALPNSAYTSAEFFKLEQQTVFRCNWVFAAFAHQLPGKGDMLPCAIAGQPIVIVRGDDFKIRAFHNVCRHRGAQLIQEPQSGRKNFICPNHSWSYDLKGRLKMRPHFMGGGKHDVNQMDCHRADLVEIKCENWFDWIFVNVDGKAGDFFEYLKPVTDKLEGYDFTDLHFSKSLEFDLRANWKLAVENFIEPYHVFSCHPWLNDFVSMEERDPPQFKDHVLSCGYEFQKADPARGGQLPWFPDLPADKQNRGDWFVLFPNFAFEIFPDQVDVFIATPLAANQSRETIALYFIGDGATSDHYANARDYVVQNWHDLNQEDIGIIERMQAGRSSEGFDGGVLSPYWDPVQQHFARLIYDSIKHSI